jgi:hypothetical protein
MDDGDRQATPEEDKMLMATFLHVAMGSILDPTAVNKFAVSNTHTGAPVVVFGSAALVEIPGFIPRTPYATVACAITLEKRIAEDLVVNLQQAFAITEDDMSEAIRRSAIPSGRES